MKTSLAILCTTFFLVGCTQNTPTQTQVNKSDSAMYKKFLSVKAHQELSKEVEKLEK